MATRRPNQNFALAEPDITTRLSSGMAGGAPVGQKTIQPVRQPAAMDLTGMVPKPYNANPVVPPAAPAGQQAVPPMGQQAPAVMPAPAPAAPATESTRDAVSRLSNAGRLSFADFEKGLGYSLSGPGAGKSQVGAMGAIAKFGGNPGALRDATYEYENANEGGTFMESMQGKALDPAFLDTLRNGGYTFDIDRSGRHPRARMYDAQGNLLGRDFSVGDTGTKFDNFMEKAVPIGLGLLTGGALAGPALGALGMTAPGAVATGAATGAIGGATSTAVQGGSFKDTLAAALMGGLGGAAGGAVFGGSGGVPGGDGAFLGEGMASAAPDIGNLGLSEAVYGAGGALGPGLTPGSIGGLAGSTAELGGLGSFLPSSVGYGSAAGGLAGAGFDLSTVGGPDPSGMVPTSPGDLQSFPVPEAAAPEYLNAAMDSQAANVPGVAGTQPPIATVPPSVDLGSLGGIMGTGAAVPSIFNSAADSQAANVYNQTTPGSLPTTPPASVDLGSLGRYATGGGIANNIANALEAAKVNPVETLQSAGSSLVDFAKANPRLAALGVSGLTTLAGGSPDFPSLPGAGGSGGGGTGAPGTLQAALEQHMNSMGATPDYGTIPGLKTSAGDLNTLNQEAIDAAYSQQTRMLDPQFQREMQTMEARLAEQGFVPGTPGYERAMNIFGEERTKAYGSARDSSILQGYNIGQGDARNKLADAELNNAASRETLAQILAKRNQPFNELASLKGNQQIDYNNQIERYNAQTSSSNSRNQALSQLALALGMYLG